MYNIQQLDMSIRFRGVSPSGYNLKTPYHWYYYFPQHTDERKIKSPKIITCTRQLSPLECQSGQRAPHWEGNITAKSWKMVERHLRSFRGMGGWEFLGRAFFSKREGQREISWQDARRSKKVTAINEGKSCRTWNWNINGEPNPTQKCLVSVSSLLFGRRNKEN